MHIREAVDSDHDAIIELVLRRCRQLTPPMVAGIVRDASLTVDRTMLVAHGDGALAGTAVQFQLPGVTPSQFTRYVIVAEHALGRGLARDLVAELDARLPDRVTDLAGTADADDDHTLAVLDHWGWQTMQTSVTSELPLDDLPDLVLPPDVSVEVSNGLTFADETAVEAMLNASQTNPERAHNGAMTLAQLRGWLSPGGDDTPLGLVLRVDGRPAALSFGIIGSGLVQLVYTGVDPTFRGRGLARLLKQAAHAAAREAGASVAVTNNEEGNTGIRHVNDQLGYRRTSAVVWLRRRVG